MATENKSSANKRRKQYLPHNKPVRKGAYPLRPGVQGFFITCDGGRERQASHEAINVIDSFYEELVHGKESTKEQAKLPQKPLGKITKFTYSDSSSDDDDNDADDGDANGDGHKDEVAVQTNDVEKSKSSTDPTSNANNGTKSEEQTQESKEKAEDHENLKGETEEPPAKKQCLETDASKSGNILSRKVEEKSVDRLIEEELAELGDKSKRRFSNLESGCNGVVFVQMRKRDGDPSPQDITQYMMTSLASTRKHVSRFLLRVLPVEVSCYASDEEIRRAINPVIAKYFPEETETPRKFAVLYDARANTGIDRMKIIDTVAKCVPSPHKVDLSNPDIHIVVQIVKTVCLIGVVEKYKEFSKYNVRQLTSPKQ